MDGIHISIIYEEELPHSKELYKVDNSEDPYMLGIYEKKPLLQSFKSSESSGDEFPDDISKKKCKNKGMANQV
ncbi:hypothetical protein RclHR1_20350004 [Rhizophagus clarus]|uniref:Uncharacterized protein n=1 Tax=Rhizophagus clarus TaxID=94130 RepID=A0A2Z6R3P3_9GLOM|nr:hypothetical protein RclHR1_20350004 [Rhizophagus clarus]